MDFYIQMPFNYTQSAKIAAQNILAQDPLPYLAPPLVELLTPESLVADIGCGPGWLSNVIAYYYKSQVTGVDFNPVAIDRARETTKELGLDVRFQVADLFEYVNAELFDFVFSIGVLHHTNDCRMGVRKVCGLAKEQGFVAIGLYHTYGRRPFLEYFTKLKAEGLTVEQLFEKYKELDSRHLDVVQARSWFLDQVLHPHETCHTLEEVAGLFDECGVELVSTSINRFSDFSSRQELFDLEKYLAEAGRKALAEQRYYPGFFLAIGRRTR
ncbi:putative methyltransferase [Megalodesulfovibrio gigas DSM 1382 = ATCC 19364]|uniref:Putative methyltransferase n=1 Tax=Megalodesulfovibrio gigas (strain ATCC 19364 / DSM 1382 / NCIMB 9332 / VKM B-1759) TaxID=1121448 RepID=T2G6T6_MEGG1|nr:putative methyltransferase [Megalodesulfovibrio gigas DSM 1382 = ATCC 19364]